MKKLAVLAVLLAVTAGAAFAAYPTEVNSQITDVKEVTGPSGRPCEVKVYKAPSTVVAPKASSMVTDTSSSSTSTSSDNTTPTIQPRILNVDPVTGEQTLLLPDGNETVITPSESQTQTLSDGTTVTTNVETHEVTITSPGGQVNVVQELVPPSNTDPELTNPPADPMGPDDNF